VRRYQTAEVLEVVAAFERGDIIAFPTDTVFGVGCCYDNEEAIQRIKDIKGRDAHKPLPMMVDGVAMLEKYAVVDARARKLITNFCPGALTLILNKKEDLPSYVNDGKDSLAIRIPNDEFILELLRRLNKPLLVTSANKSGNDNLNKWEDVERELKEIDGIVCGDALSLEASTIIDISKEKTELIRLGKIKEKEIKEVLNV